MAPSEQEDRDPLEVLAAEFLDRQRGGEYPSISEYVAQHPDLAAEIEDLFPRLPRWSSSRPTAKAPAAGVWLRARCVWNVSATSVSYRRSGGAGWGSSTRAYQESLDRHVAVKVLPRQFLLDSRQLERFQHEAQTAARLHHTNIVPLFGVGEQDGYHYLVMQLIHGVSLDNVLVKLRQFGNDDRAVDGVRGAPSPAPESGSTSEAVRLARALVESRFWQVGESGVSLAKAAKGTDASVSVGDDRPAVVEKDSAAADKSPIAAEKPSVTPDKLAAVAAEKPSAAAEPDSQPHPAFRSHRSERAIVRDRIGPAYWRSVAAIGMQAADALHYAHVHQTLHRDVKPANLLLDSQGVVWITDFGLAKALEQDQASQTALAGTLRYMAPEQFSGHVDARSDVYSLGLTLYELLTLQPAFSDVSRSQLIRKITQEQPVRPRQLNRADPARSGNDRAQGDRSRAGRSFIGSAAELSRDLERFLEDRPIAAPAGPRRSSAFGDGRGGIRPWQR